MLRQLQTAVMKQLCTIDHRMHKKIFALWHMSYFIPAKYFVLRKTPAVLHDLFTCCSLFLIYKIADKKIHCFRSAQQLIQSFQNADISFFIYPVITVHNFKIQTCSIPDSCIYSLSMSTIFLMNCFHNSRIFFRIGICDLCSSVRGSVIHHKDFYLFSAYEQ